MSEILKFNNSWPKPPSGANSYLTASEHYEVIGRRSYPVVTMQDGRDWLAVNLDLMWSGLSVPTSAQNLTAAPQVPAAVYYNYDQATYGWDGEQLGLLYNGAAVSQLISNASTLFPGWHVPTLDEWYGLYLAIAGGQYSTLYVGDKLKSETGWQDGNGGNPQAPYIFNAKAAGDATYQLLLFYQNLTFTHRNQVNSGQETHFATSTAGSTSGSFASVSLQYSNDFLYPFGGNPTPPDLSAYKNFYSVRLIRDEAADPLNPLGLPNNTMRFEFDRGYDPTNAGVTWPSGMTWTQISQVPNNVWDMYYPSADWNHLFTEEYGVNLIQTSEVHILGANTRYVCDFSRFFTFSRGLRTITPFRLDHALTLEHMFSDCPMVESGALALYQQASAFANPPYHENAFLDCGSSTTTGAAELAQIPTDWGGTMA